MNVSRGNLNCTCSLKTLAPRLEETKEYDGSRPDSLALGGAGPGAPAGFVLQLSIFSTWGDPYYVGLTGVELYDPSGSVIPLNESSELLLIKN